MTVFLGELGRQQFGYAENDEKVTGSERSGDLAVSADCATGKRR
jgi:hypothetical protein